MTQAAASLTQTDIARLMGDLGHVTVTHLIGVLGQEVLAGRRQWAPRRPGVADTFGPDLAARVRSGATLSKRTVNSARTGLLQRNWLAVVDVLTRDVVRVSDRVIRDARQGRSPVSVTINPQPVAAPAAAAAAAAAAPTPVCNKRLFYSDLRCVEPRGHDGGCIGNNENPATPPTNDVDSVLSGGLKANVTVTLTQTTPDPAGQDAQIRRFALVIEAAWDDIAAAPLPEPETDASIERFRLLDLDD
jgi:hypothetical protein